MKKDNRMCSFGSVNIQLTIQCHVYRWTDIFRRKEVGNLLNLSVQIVRPCLFEQVKRTLWRRRKWNKKNKIKIRKGINWISTWFLWLSVYYVLRYPRGFCANMCLRSIAIGVFGFVSLYQYYSAKGRRNIVTEYTTLLYIVTIVRK